MMGDADIIASHTGHSEVTLSAKTPKGQAWLKAPSKRVHIDEAPAIREAAEAEGLIVKGLQLSS
jgi:hypothetical protein